MKKRSLLFLAIVFAMVTSAFAGKVTVQTAQRVAQSFLNFMTEGRPEIHLIDFAEKAEFPNFYVFGNERCFVIIAADYVVHPVLGYSTDGGFATNEMPEEVYDWLKRYENAIEALAETNPERSMEVQAEWNRLLNGNGLEPKLRTRVMPLIKTKWSHKKTPFNNLCPVDTANHSTGHAQGGCGAGAMSQLMNYWEHPVRGLGTHSYTPTNHPEYGTQYANFGGTVYDWDNMKNVYALGYTDAEALAVATLIYHCAVSLDMNFGPNASYTNPSKVAASLKNYFDYSQTTTYRLKSNYSDAIWKSMLRNDLDLGRPVVYRGRDVTDEIGHIFICDGYDENDYFHFNFDWAGNYDGYYLIGDINVNGTDFDHENTAIFECYPNPTSINPPSNINASVSNRNVTVSWSTVSGASYYKLYRDEDLIANNIHSTSCTDVNVAYGNHSYYVKSVKSDGTMSLRSNTAVADVHFGGPAPTNLQASVSGYNVILSWQTETPESAILQYGTGNCTGRGGTNDQGTRTSWAQRFPVSIIQDYIGMAVEKVGFYVYPEKIGEYTVSIYKGDEMNANELVYEQSYTATTSGCWHDIEFPTPVVLDCTQDLWVVFSSFVYKPASYCAYSGPYHDDAILYSNTQTDHRLWQRLTDQKAWLIKTYLTDGTYTYNLYRDGTAVTDNLTGNTYTDANLPDGFYDYHVTTNYFGGESDPSNTVHVQVGNPSYTITATANPTNGGTVTGGGTYNYNQTCTLTATPNLGYTFTNWTENGTVVSTNASYSFTVTGNRNLVAHFQLQSFTVTVSANPNNGGSVTGDGTYNYGQSCTVTATPNTGYNFLNWTENGNVVSSNASYSFTVTDNRNLVAHFQLQSFIVTVSVDPINGGMVTGSGTYNYNQSCTVTATPNTGYNFINWTENGNVVSTNANYTFTVTGNRTLVAHFTMQSYVITAIADPIEGGTVTGAGGYNYGETCTLHATANACYSFDGWTENGNTVSNEADYSFTVTRDCNLVANFTKMTYEITAEVNPESAGVITGTGTYQCGETCTLTAIAYENYTFLNWTENGNVITTQSTIQIQVTESHHFVANYSYYDGIGENTKSIEAYPNPANNILTIKGEGIRRVTVINMKGQVMEVRDTEGMEEIQIIVQGYSSGFYVLQLMTEGGVVTKHFINE